MLSGNLAATEQYNQLFETLSDGREHELERHQHTAVDELLAEAIDAPRRTAMYIITSAQPGVIYDVELAGFEAIVHDVHGQVLECIGYFSDSSDRKVKVGVSLWRGRNREMLYVKLA
jgi:hypothetical protein